MSWFTPLAGLKKKICRYLLQRYLGQFLEEKLNLEQLNVDLYNGTGSVSNVALNCEALNEICENQGWGIEVTGGHIGSVTVTVPWNALMTDDSSIEVKQLFISIKPLPRQNDGTSMFESMWSSMSNSMQLARECLEKDNDDDIQINEQNTTIEGLEKFAQTIDSILNRVKAKFIDTEIRLEYLPSNSDCGLAIIVKIDRLDYQNEAGDDPYDDTEESKSSDEHSKKIHLLSTYATHRISFEGIKFYTKEFRAVNFSLKQQESKIESLICSKQFYSITSQLPETQKHLFSDNLNVSKENDSIKSIVTGTSDTTENENQNENENENLIEIYSSENIMIMRIDGKQEIYIKMKQFENVYGPKVHLEMQLGRINLFISPRQLHLIMKFFNLFFSNDQQQQQQQQQLLQNKIDNDNAELLSKRQNELQKIQKCYSSMSGIIAGNEGFWSEPGNEAKSIQQTASKSINNNTVCGGTFSSTLADDYCESINSSMTSSSTTNSLRFRHKSQNIGSNGDISYFNFRIGSVIIVLLHEDILLENSISNDNPLSKESVSKLISLSEEFFNNIDDDIKLTNSPIITCTKNHLELTLKPIIVEGEQQRDNNVIILKATLSITKIDFDEILQNYSIPLIKFKREELVIGGIHKRPEFILTLKTNSSRKLSNSKMDKKDICLKLESCIMEFDITLYDRLNSILGPSPFNVDVTSFASFSDIDVISPITIQSETVTGTSSTTKNRHHESNTTELKLEAPNVDINLRFPIVDTRPLHDPNRIPWWKQNIRSDFLLFSIQLFRLNYSHSAVEIMANEIDLFYCNNNDSPKIHIGKTNLISTKGNGMNRNQSSIEYPRISINFPFDKSFATLSKSNIDDSDSGETSGESCALFSKSPKEYLPFSSKRVCRQSDTPHIKTDIDEAETILLPGESEEMKKFCELSTKTSKLQIKVSLPTASLQINSKHLYEVLYNRLNTDLLMWEPIAPNLSNKSKNSINSTPIIDQCLSNVGMMDSMYIPSPSSTSATTSKKKLHRDNNESSSLESSDTSEENESDNDGDDNNDDSDDHNLYYSAYDRKRFSKRYHHQLKQNTNNRNRLQLSACSFELEIGDGILTLYAPVRDNENRVLPGQLGEFILKANKFNLFSVNGYRENVNLAYLCIQLKSIEAYHCGLISNIDNDVITPSLRLYTNEMPSYIQATLYPTQKNSTLSNNQGSIKREMLSFAVEIKKNPEQRLKRLKITTGIQNTTLKHNPAITQHTWLNQIIDMFDVVDYPIEGYKPYSILAEMQLHLWDCAIDYRPLNFAFRAIAEIGTLMISSNLTTTTAGCTLRFIAEECILSLAPYDFKSNRNIPKNKIMSLPSKELISILDLGLLDISLRLNEKATELFPKFDLRSSIQDMHIRTCSDSGRALAHLIAYIANDGDLTISNEKDVEQEKRDIEDEGSLLSVKECSQTVPEITEKQQERVNTLMAEALQETDNIAAQQLRDDDELKSNRSVEVFFFPDESQQLKKLKEEKHLVKTDQKSQDSISINDDSTSTSTLELSANQSHEKKSDIIPDADCLILDADGASGGGGVGVAGSSVNSDEWNFDRESTGSELRDLLNFETSVMYNSYNLHDEVVEALPEIREELGEINITKPKLVNEKKTRRNSFNLEDDFCFISEEDKAYMSKCGKEVEISNDPLRIVDNHFSLPMGKSDLLKAPENFPMAVMRYTLCEMTVTWHLYGGHDFPIDDEKLPNKSDDDDSMMFLKPMSETYKTGVSYSKSQQTVQFNNKKSTAKTSWKTKGGFKRNHDVLIEIMLTKVKLSHEIYPKHTTQASRQVIVVSELEIRDRLQTSEINKFLYHPLPRHLSNKSSQHMIVIKALHVRPNPILLTQECSLRISLLPLRLNIDQDALLFLVQFFNELSSTGNDDNSLNKRNTTTKETQPPVMMVDDIPESVQDLQARQMISKNLNLLMDDEQPKDKNIEKQPPTTIVQESTNNLPIYFKEIIFSPDVLIRLDYHGRRIEMSRGPIAGLLMGLGQLQCSEIRLKKIFHRHGILGLDRLLNFLLQEWLQDIKKNQLPSILSGVGPMYTFVQLFQGIRDLFWLPIEQYQKDGRIVRGLQLGAQSFTARTALAALEITARIIQLLQITAETAFDMVSPGPSVRRIRNNRKGKRKRPHRPQDIREGVANAYQIVKEGINETANTLIETTVAEHDQKGYTGAVGAVFRQIPPIALRPVVLATQATTNVLGGVKSQLVPDARFEAKEKWKNDTD